MQAASYYKQQQQTPTNRSRVDTIVALYDHAIVNLEICGEVQQGDDPQFVKAFVAAQTALLGLQAGLDVENDETARNIARLLLFVAQRVEAHDFPPALRTLRPLRDSFAAISEQANALEANGEIPSLMPDSGIRVTA